MWRCYLLCFVILCSVFLSCIRVSEDKESSQKDTHSVQQKALTAQRGHSLSSATSENQLSNTSDPSSNKTFRDLSQLIEAVEPAIVRLDVTRADDNGVGSGFLVAPGDLVVTNYHVVSGATTIVAVFRDKASAPVLGVTHTDSKRDLAVLKLSRRVPGSTVLTFRETIPKKGEAVVAFGAPRGLSFSATEGIISGLRTAQEINELGAAVEGKWIQTSTPISPGNSGGPLVDMRGKVVGVNTMQLTRGQNLNFAVSANEANRIVKLAKDKPLASFPKEPIVRAIATKQSKVDPEQSPNWLSLKKKLDEQIAWQRQQLILLKHELEKNKKLLKSSLLAIDDQQSELRKRAIQGTITKYNAMIAPQIKVPKIYIQPNRRSSQPIARVGDVGMVAPRSFDVFQVIDESRGDIFAKVDYRLTAYRSQIIFLRNLYGNDFQEDGTITIDENMIFVRLEDYSYKTSIGTNTIPQFAVVAHLNDFAKPLADALTISAGKPTLTPQESALIADRRTMIERNKLVEERTSKAAALLRLAKQFRKLGKTDIAQKRYRTIVDEYPETSAAIEAAQVLNISSAKLEKAKQEVYDQLLQKAKETVKKNTRPIFPEPAFPE